MRNALKSLFIVLGCLTASATWAETMYVVSGQCNVPLVAGMNNAKAQFFTWDGNTATVTTAVSCNITATAGFYYNSTSLAYADITDASKYSSTSSASRTMRGFKITGSETMTISLGSITVSKVIVGGRCASNDACTLNVAGETVSTNNKNPFIKVVEGSFNNQISIANSSGKEYNVIVYLIEGQATPVAVESVALNKTSTTIEIGNSETLTATVSPSNAGNQAVTWSSSDNSVATVTDEGLVTAISAGTATITVTTEDGNKKATCTINVPTPPEPIPVTAIALSDASVAVGSTTTLTVTYTPADANTGKAISTWTSSNTAVATVANGVVTGVSAGTATITATTEGGKTASCTVTVSVVEVTGVSLDKSSADLQIGGTTTLTATVAPADATNKALTWSSSNTAVATVGNGVVTGVGAGTATITVASVADPTKTATCTINVTDGPPVPYTTLSIHEPEVYEAKTKDGGYGGSLVKLNEREYEVYYAGRWDNGGTKLTMHIDPIDKSQGITKNESSSGYEAIDGWFKGTGTDKGTGFAAQDEFEQATARCHTISSSNSVELHIKGYDQFALYGADKKWSATKPSDCKYFKVLIDEIEQTMAPSTDQTIRRFNISTTEHVIKIIHSGGEASLFGGFSLRVPQAPKIKKFKGNDTAQVILQTMPINKIVYTCKYNHIAGAETRLVWEGGNEATGIALDSNVKQGDLVDTITLTGNANCPVGIYHYSIVTYLNGAETSRATGHFEVISDIRALSSVNVEAYQNEEMDQILFKYYALSANDVQLTWPQGKPQGTVDGHSNQPGEYIISGTPTNTGTFPFEITVLDADTVIKGVIIIKELNYGTNPVLYLYKNDAAYTKDGVYAYLQDANTYNLIPRRAKTDGLRPSNQYANYKWVLISEDVDADNPEILALARGEGNLPVLNMQAFSYTKDRLEWGDPNYGSLTKDEGRYITVVRDDHPIFKALNKHNGDRIQVLDSTGNKGLMPIAVNYTGTLCLATARTRDINDYYGNGPEETFLHEIPANMHRNQKYLCLPIGQSGSNYLHADGKRLIDECIKYILGNEPTIQLPELAITDFRIGSYTGVRDENKNLITLEVLAKDSDLMKAATPQITLASPLTHVSPAVSNADGTVNFSNWHYGVRYIVSDYINKHSYDVIVHLQEPQGIDEIEAGEWINIFDIYGRKIATTNEDYRTMDLPRGMYILVTESGKTLKIMR